MRRPRTPLRAQTQTRRPPAADEATDATRPDRDSIGRDGSAVSRRRFLAGSAIGVAGLGIGVGVDRAVDSSATAPPQGPYRDAIVPFYGAHQAGVISPNQDHTYFAAFDLDTKHRDEVVDLLREWTQMSARLCVGETAAPDRPNAPVGDTGEAVGLGPAQLTLTFGFAPSMFTLNGEDRYGLAKHRPAALVELPRFQGDEIDAASSGGDVTVQACANDPQVAFHAVRELARIAKGAAKLRWTQAAYQTTAEAAGTPRNLLGFKDGTANPNTTDPAQMDHYVWVGAEGPGWMRSGSYLVLRRIRTTIERWDQLTVSQQESVVGRHKLSGAPLGEHSEFAALDLDAKTAAGEPVIPIDAHVRLAARQNNGGSQILRRVYNYNNGVDQFTERWPPWRQGLEYDIGVLFGAYQRDPRTGFIRIFGNLALNDAFNQFTTHTASILAAIPPGAPRPGAWIGQPLFNA